MTVHTNSSLLLTSCILFANLDTTGLLESALKALIGGGIWLAFKKGSEYFDKRKKKKK